MKPQFSILRCPFSYKGYARWDRGMSWQTPAGASEVYWTGPQKRLTELKVIVRAQRLTDFVWTDGGHFDCLIQHNVLNSFLDNELSGFEARPVSARRPLPRSKRTVAGEIPSSVCGPSEIPPLWELVVTGWGGVAPPESGLRLCEKSPGHQWWTGPLDPSKLIDERLWDGSDFFFVWPLPGEILVTDRVAQIVRSIGFTGVEVVPIEDMWVLPPNRSFSTGDLSAYLPEPRAREIGEPLGIY